jgi:hypothetical protein
VRLIFVARSGERVGLHTILYAEGLGDPGIFDLHVVTMPQVNTLDALLHGFVGPPIKYVILYAPCHPRSCPAAWHGMPHRQHRGLAMCLADRARSSLSCPSSSYALRPPTRAMTSTLRC